MTLDKYILAELHRLRKVQRKIELLKPELDEAIERLERLWAAMEKAEKTAAS